MLLSNRSSLLSPFYLLMICRYVSPGFRQSHNTIRVFSSAAVSYSRITTDRHFQTDSVENKRPLQLLFEFADIGRHILCAADFHGASQTIFTCLVVSWFFTARRRVPRIQLVLHFRVQTNDYVVEIKVNCCGAFFLRHFQWMPANTTSTGSPFKTANRV